jgi:cobyrinic acid a,c-diamide synthase
VRIGVLRDAPFSFYYPENLAALERAGAELVPISTLEDADVGTIDALYAGGGFPEVRAAELSRNGDLRRALRRRIDEGLPVWAECGGLMYLARELCCDGESYPMVGALPLVVEQTKRPQGHGYVEGRVDRDNPFLPRGLGLRGHEFHYSRVHRSEEAPTVFALGRDTGLGDGRDGMHVGNVVASYTHVHALGLPQWAPGLVQAARAGVLKTDNFDPEEDSTSHVESVLEGTGSVPSMSA